MPFLNDSKMRIPVFCLLGALLAALSAADTHAGDPVGVRTIAVPSALRPVPLKVTIWHPATAGGTPTLFGEDRLLRARPPLTMRPSPPGGFRSCW
jgi:hypothetical protein